MKLKIALCTLISLPLLASQNAVMPEDTARVAILCDWLNDNVLKNSQDHTTSASYNEFVTTTHRNLLKAATTEIEKNAKKYNNDCRRLRILQATSSISVIVTGLTWLTWLTKHSQSQPSPYIKWGCLLSPLLTAAQLNDLYKTQQAISKDDIGNRTPLTEEEKVLIDDFGVLLLNPKERNPTSINQFHQILQQQYPEKYKNGLTLPAGPEKE